MKKVLKILGVALLALVAAIVLVLTYIAISGIPRYQVESINHSVTSTNQPIKW